MSNTRTVSVEQVHNEHLVQFYDGDNFIKEMVAQFLGAGLKAGQPLVLISTLNHRDSIYEAMSALGYNGPEALASGRLKWLDARETLSGFMVDDMPDDQLFRASVGEVLDQSRCGREHVTIRAFGEMVDLLLSDGNPEAALRLEELWNELGKLYGFSLLCAYSIGNLYREEHWRFFKRICDQHVRVSSTDINAVRNSRESTIASTHIPAASVRDFAFGTALLSGTQLSHFSDCDVCSELWWRLRQAARPHLRKTS